MATGENHVYNKNQVFIEKLIQLVEVLIEKTKNKQIEWEPIAGAETRGFINPTSYRLNHESIGLMLFRTANDSYVLEFRIAEKQPIPSTDLENSKLNELVVRLFNVVYEVTPSATDYIDDFLQVLLEEDNT